MLILKIQSDTKRTDNSLPKPRTILNNIFIIQYGRNEKIRFFFHKTTIRIILLPNIQNLNKHSLYTENPE